MTWNMVPIVQDTLLLEKQFLTLGTLGLYVSYPE